MASTLNNLYCVVVVVLVGSRAGADTLPRFDVAAAARDATSGLLASR